MLTALQSIYDFFKGRKPDPDGTIKVRKDGWEWRKNSHVTGGWERVKEVRKVARAKPKKPRKKAAPRPKPEKKAPPKKRGPKKKIPKETSVLRAFDAAFKKFVPAADQIIKNFEFNYSERMNRNISSARDADDAVRALRTIADDLRHQINHTQGEMTEKLTGLGKDHELWGMLKRERAGQIEKAKQYGRILDGTMQNKIMELSRTLRARLVSAHNPQLAEKGVFYLPEYASESPKPATVYDGTGSVDREAGMIFRRKKPEKMWNTGRYVESESRIDGDYWISNGFMRVRANLVPPRDKAVIQANYYGDRPISPVVRKSMALAIRRYDDKGDKIGLNYSFTIGRNGKPKKVFFQASDGEEVAVPQGYVKFFLGIDPNAQFKAVRDAEMGVVDEDVPVAVYSNNRLIGMIQHTDTYEDDMAVLHRHGRKSGKAVVADTEAEGVA